MFFKVVYKRKWVNVRKKIKSQGKYTFHCYIFFEVLERKNNTRLDDFRFPIEFFLLTIFVYSKKYIKIFTYVILFSLNPY
jgi:hypothetical protein